MTNFDYILTGDSGLKDDFDATFAASKFEMSDYGAVRLHLQAVPDDDTPVQHFWFNVGKGWDTYDGGQTVSPPPGTLRLRKDVAYFKFIQDAINAGADSVITERNSSYAVETTPGLLVARIWDDLRFHFEVENDPTAQEPDPNRPGKFRLKAGGKDVQKVTRYLGVGEPVVANIVASVENVFALPTINEDDLAAITQVAQESPDLGSFRRSVLAIPGMTQNRAVVGKLADDTWYNELRS